MEHQPWIAEPFLHQNASRSILHSLSRPLHVHMNASAELLALTVSNALSLCNIKFTRPGHHLRIIGPLRYQPQVLRFLRSRPSRARTCYLLHMYLKCTTTHAASKSSFPFLIHIFHVFSLFCTLILCRILSLSILNNFHGFSDIIIGSYLTAVVMYPHAT